jgi:hypothetical protein
MLLPPAMIGFMVLGTLYPMGAQTVPTDEATIVNSGSTNRAGFRIAVDRTGTAEWTSVPRRRLGAPQEQAQPVRKTLASALTDRFYADLAAAKPFSSLPPVHCAKSASFGTVLTVKFGDEESPDLSCGDGGNAALKALIRDANEIVALFNSN